MVDVLLNADTPLGRPSTREEDIVHNSLVEFQQLQLWRNTFAGQWEEIAELIAPVYRNTFFFQNFNWPGQKKTDRQIDCTGMLALEKFGAICNSLITPRNMIWHGIKFDDDYIMRQRGVRLYCDQLRDLCFKQRYKPYANFSGQNAANFMQLGAFGTLGMFVDALDPNYGRGLRYCSIPLGELFLRENHQRLVDGFIRWFKLTPRQAKQKWPNQPLPGQLQTALEAQSEYPFNFIHRVVPRDDFDPDRLDARGKFFASYYISVEGRQLMSEGGYHSLPLPVGRYSVGPYETYGRGPATFVLPSLKTLNAEKRMFLKQGHRAADPVLLTADDGIVDGVSMRPGAVNKGGVTTDGKLLVRTLPTGEIQVSKEMMAEESMIIKDAFLVTLFQILTETPQMTATEVIERTAEKGILLAPSMGRQQDEYLGTLIPRELDVLTQLGMTPPMPGVVAEYLRAGGSLETTYTNPLARAMRAQEAAGFMRTVETVKELVAVTGDTSLLDPFEFQVAIPEIADIQAVPERWMASPQSMKQKAQQRAKMMAREQRIKELPSEAAMVKAQAVAAKAGQGQSSEGAIPPAQGQQQAA